MFPYFPVGQDRHWLALTWLENWPGPHPVHENPPPPADRIVAYPGLHTHCSSVDPAGESEYAGQPVHDPEKTPLYVFAAQVVHPVAPCIENLPAGHQAHDRYVPAPSSGENVPLGHGWHVWLLVAPTASENRPTPHSTQLDTRSAPDQVPAGHDRHAVKLPAE